MSFIFYTTKIFGHYWTRLNGTRFLKSHPVLKKGMRICKKSILLMLGTNEALSTTRGQYQSQV
jgi:hypothetical protein